jgi:hypothetical protein
MPVSGQFQFVRAIKLFAPVGPQAQDTDIGEFVATVEMVTHTFGVLPVPHAQDGGGGGGPGAGALADINSAELNCARAIGVNAKKNAATRHRVFMVLARA